MENPEKTVLPHSFRETIQFYLIDSKTTLGKAIDIFINLLNIIVVAIFIIETYPVAYEGTGFRSALVAAEYVIVAIFIVEYIARLYGARKRIIHIVNPYSIIDFVAILPTLLFFIGAEHIGILKLLRMFRVFRVLRFLRLFKTTEFFFGKISNEMLKVMRLIMTIFMIFFVASGLFYLVESPVNNLVQNFGDAFYFAVVALTTVGFGDIIPLSGQGKAVTVLCILSGIALIPWQVAEIVREWIHISHKTSAVCENCGLMYHDKDAVHCKACGHIIYQEYDER
ncbi:ion transporter [candidate division KSB1 bacterium]